MQIFRIDARTGVSNPRPEEVFQPARVHFIKFV